jgi:D-alanine-D-alanine ligase-like ATP-grasp enzyme
VSAAQGLTYPVIVKPNIGGSGAKIQRFEERATLAAAARSATLDLGVDSVALVQEFLPARGGCIVRVEVMDGKFLYAIKIVPPAQGGFNLCPADICQDEGDIAATAEPSAAPDFAFCPATEPARRTMQIENFDPPSEIIDAALRIAKEASLDIGGMEYLINDRDGQPYFYDINALSNFVTDAPRIVGFDPFPRFVDFIERRMKSA